MFLSLSNLVVVHILYLINIVLFTVRFTVIIFHVSIFSPVYIQLISLQDIIANTLFVRRRAHLSRGSVTTSPLLPVTGLSSLWPKYVYQLLWFCLSFPFRFINTLTEKATLHGSLFSSNSILNDSNIASLPDAPIPNLYPSQQPISLSGHKQGF